MTRESVPAVQDFVPRRHVSLGLGLLPAFPLRHDTLEISLQLTADQQSVIMSEFRDPLAAPLTAPSTASFPLPPSILASHQSQAKKKLCHCHINRFSSCRCTVVCSPWRPGFTNRLCDCCMDSFTCCHGPILCNLRGPSFITSTDFTTVVSTASAAVVALSFANSGSRAQQQAVAATLIVSFAPAISFSFTVTAHPRVREKLHLAVTQRLLWHHQPIYQASCISWHNMSRLPCLLASFISHS